MDLETIRAVIQSYGLAVLFPIAILEGPIVTVIAAWFARQGLMSILGVYIVCVVADVVGDAGFYWLGRHGLSPRWQRRLGLTPDRRRVLKRVFRDHGARALVIGKLTHSAGAAVLLAAGASRMGFGRFVWWNTVATIPKTLLFTVIGWSFGWAAEQVNGWIAAVSLAMLVVMLLAGGWWLGRRYGTDSGVA
ncbi:MAG: VTT domain-containing protein [Paracoccus sp. (in: a-proteobacteria)]|uniref:DedA family protein n=1 Tax=Paracoccus sp. TaxID=267 RepID=UPI0026DF2A05|nr:VTT domain-containing protein [Paracoccus sp. (in: a-proteobacteria)]MDO5611777.1 VTT domain-containing protein [Paracoccus sp. (in: a-proteobacteria)]